MKRSLTQEASSFLYSDHKMRYLYPALPYSQSAKCSTHVEVSKTCIPCCTGTEQDAPPRTRPLCLPHSDRAVRSIRMVVGFQLSVDGAASVKCSVVVHWVTHGIDLSHHFHVEHMGLIYVKHAMSHSWEHFT